MKKWYISKTVIFNLVYTSSVILAMPELTKYVDMQLLLVIQGVLNVILRVFFTDTGVEKKII